MKKVLLSAVALLTIGFANAQEGATSTGGFAQGDMFISGGFGFDSGKQGDYKESEFTFSPAFGYFVSDNIAVGARLDVTSGKEEMGSSEDKMNSFGADVFGRYYMTPASQFSVFGELAVGFGNSKYEYAGGGEDKYKMFGVNAGVGVNYFLSNNFAIEAGWAGLGYNSMKQDVSGAEAMNTFGLNVDLSAINFGLTYKF